MDTARINLKKLKKTKTNQQYKKLSKRTATIKSKKKAKFIFS
jgi:hypothetical protein